MRQPAAKSSKPASTKAKTAKAAYTSFNRDERAQLQLLGLRERWVYMELKWLANFKTGTVGEFGQQRLTFGDIAALLTVPGVQGRGQGSIDDTQARDFLQRMETVGLVANIGRRVNGGLRFDLPLSPIDRAAAKPSGENGGEVSDISPAGSVPEIAANAAPATVCGEPALSLSVLVSKNANINTDGAGSAAAEPAPCRAIGAAPVRENPPAQPRAAALTAREIQDAIGESWTFTGIDTPEAKQLYASWSDAGITLDDLHAAMIGVEEAEGDATPTPADLAPRLWPLVVDGFTNQLAA